MQLSTSQITSHSVALSGLAPNTSCHYRVKSRDVSENEAISEEQTFTTLPASVIPEGELSVYFIDVGQGDSILIDYDTYEVL